MTTRGNPLLLFLAGLGEPVANRCPFGRVIVDREGWSAAVGELAGRSGWTAEGLWADGSNVHLALTEDDSGDTAVITLDCPEGNYPAVSPARASVSRLERMIFDTRGLRALGAIDERPWYDHQREPYVFLPSEGPGLHQIPVGPVHAGIIEPGHFRFTINGDCVVRLEERLGYVHKGIERLFEGKTPLEAATLACRISGDSAVAHALAFARAVEATTGVEAPTRAVWIRALAAELERLANHLGDIGGVANDAAFAFLLAETSRLREATLRAADACFGHRLMMDLVVPGGVSVDLPKGAATTLLGLTGELRGRFPPLVRVYDESASLQDRTVGTGTVSMGLAHRFGAGGFVGRASGRSRDARMIPAYPPYDDLEFDVPTLIAGDVDARVRIRIAEVEQSIGLVEQIVRRIPDGPILVEIPALSGTGMALVESFRGQILTWVRMDDAGRIARCFPRDPSWFQWPLLEAAIRGNIVADFPLCNKSFNCAYSGHDL